MAQDFKYPPWNQNEDIKTTMEGIVDDNGPALLTKFSGSSDAGISTPYKFQFFADETNKEIKVRAYDNASWIVLYKWEEPTPSGPSGTQPTGIIIQDDQIMDSKINASARKPELIENQAIGPLSCTIRTKFTGASLPNYSEEIMGGSLADEATPIGRLHSGASQSMITTRIYVPDDVEDLYIAGKLTTCYIFFTLGASTSSNSSVIDPGPAWTGTEAHLDVSSISGWQDLVIKGVSSSGGPTYGDVLAIACRWGE
jgi:hypothetical protein